MEIEGVSDRVRVTITWAGGQHTRHELIRPVGRYEQTADFDRVMARIRELRAVGRSFVAIAGQLNTEGLRPPNRAVRFHKDIIGRLVRKHAPGRSNPRGPAGCRVGSGRMVRDRSGGQSGDQEGHASRLAPARLGPVPAAARLPRPLRVLGRCRGARTARPVGSDSTGLVGHAAAVGIDHAEAPSVAIG